MNNKTQTKPFGLKDKIGYMFGDFGNDFTFIFASSFLLLFYTKVLGVDGKIVGILFLVARCIDAFTDVGMGRIVDTVKPGKRGKYRRWILYIAAPVGIASFLMYQTFTINSSMTVKVIYMFITYLLWGSVFYTAINIPYGAMASAITTDPDQRKSLSTFRTVGATLASTVIGVVSPLLIYVKDVDGNQVIRSQHIFAIIAGVFAICAFICYFLCYFMVTERVTYDTKDNKKKTSFIKSLGNIITNRSLIAIIIAAILLLLAMLITMSLNNFIFADYYKSATALSTFSAATPFVTIGVVAPLATFLSTKFGKKEAAAYGMILSAVIYIILFIVRPSSVWVFATMLLITSVGYGIFNMLVWANITDVIDDIEVKKHTREDGTVYAIYSFARKLGQALAGGLSGFILSGIGYVSSASVQTDQVLHSLFSVYTILPAIIFLLIALVLFFLYPLGKKQVAENTKILKERKAEEN